MTPNRIHYTVCAMLAVGVLLLSGCGAQRMASEAAPAAEQSLPPVEPAAGAVAQSDGGTATDASGTTSALLNRKMIARATLEMVVANADATVTEIEAILAEQGGFIGAANLYRDSFGGSEGAAQVRGNLTLRVPAENLATTMAALEALAVEVRTRTINREDVTDQYTDLDAQLRNLQATEDELREMLAEVRAKPNARPDDILAVHNRLMEIRGQIEQVQGRKNMLDNLIGLSTIEVMLVPDVAMLPVVEEGWRPGVEARNAMRALVSSLQNLATAAIWFTITVLPILLLLALPFVLLFLIVRALLRRRRRTAKTTPQPVPPSP